MVNMNALTPDIGPLREMLSEYDAAAFVLGILTNVLIAM